MSEPVRLIISIDGVAVQAPAAVLSYDGCNAFHVGDLVNGAQLINRAWRYTGEGRFELTLECVTPGTLPVGDSGTLTVESVSEDQGHIEFTPAVFPGPALGQYQGKKGKHGRKR